MMKDNKPTINNQSISSLNLSIADVLHDYRLACESRQLSILGRKEVLTGKAKFGIFGDGKEVPQLAMARVFQKGTGDQAITGTRPS